MDVAISGASGLIGTALQRALALRGDRVRPLVRRAAQRTDEVSWDPVAGRIDAAALEGVDAVVNLAGEPLLGRWTARKKQRIRESRVQGTHLLARAVAGLTSKPRVFVSGSATGWYGVRGDEVLTEASASGAGFMAEVCRAWEAAAQPVEDAGVRLVRIRSGLVQSREGGLLKFQLLPFKLGVGGRIGDGRQWFPWVHIDDHVGAMLHLIDHGDASGAFNLTAPNPVRNADYARALGGALGRPTFMVVPTFGIKLVFGPEAAEELAAASQRVIPARLTDEVGYSFRYTELEPALRAELSR